MFDTFVHFDKTTKNVCVRVIFFSFFIYSIKLVKKFHFVLNLLYKNILVCSLKEFL